MEKENTTEANSKKNEQIQFLDSILVKIGDGDKPWYLTSADLYISLKAILSNIPKASDILERTLIAVYYFTSFINQNTHYNVVLEVDKAHELIDQLDSILSNLLATADDEVDDLRNRFSSSIRMLISALISHKEWVQSLLIYNTRAAQTNSMILFSRTITRAEQIRVVLKEVLLVVQTKYPQTCEVISTLAISATEGVQTQSSNVVKFVENKVYDSKKIFSSAEENLLENVKYWLNVAQPYVRSIVTKTQPLVNHALEFSDPYINKAKPFVDPVISQTLQLQENKTVGSYLTMVIDNAKYVISEASTYAIGGEEL
eukprot:gene10989-14763_t